MTKLKLTILLVVSLVLTSVTAQQNSEVHVNSLRDLPEPDDKEIVLESFKNYVFHGTVDLKGNYITMKGGALTGTDPGKDGVTSTYPGPILQSKREGVYLENFTVVVGSDQGSGYLFEDPSGRRYCNIFAGHSVVDAPNVDSQGVGTIKGFNSICMDLGYWNAADGLKVGGTIGKFTNSLNYVTGLKNGIGIEFLPNADVQDIVLKGNYFVVKENRKNLGMKVNPEASVEAAKLSLNLFRGVEKAFEGVNSYSPGWEMVKNGKEVPDTETRLFAYMTRNTQSTDFQQQDSYQAIKGNTKAKVNHKFNVEGNNKFIYTGRANKNVSLRATVSGNTSNYEGSYTIAFRRNDIQTIQPTSTVRGLSKGNPFNLSLTTEMELQPNDEISLFIRSNNNPDLRPIIVNEMTIEIKE